MFDDFIQIRGVAEFRFDGLPAGSYEVLTYAFSPENPNFRTSAEAIGSPNPVQFVGGDFTSILPVPITHARRPQLVGRPGFHVRRGIFRGGGQ